MVCSRIQSVFSPHVDGVYISAIELLAAHTTLQVALVFTLSSVSCSILRIAQKRSTHPAHDVSTEARNVALLSLICLLLLRMHCVELTWITVDLLTDCSWKMKI